MYTTEEINKAIKMSPARILPAVIKILQNDFIITLTPQKLFFITGDFLLSILQRHHFHAGFKETSVRSKI